MEYTSILAQAADAVTQVTEAAAETTQQASSSSNQWIILVVMFVAMWFLLIAPQRKKDKLRRKMLSETKVGDNVITIGGICGTITNKTDKTYTLKVSDSAKIEVLLSAVNQNLTQEAKLATKK